MRIIWKTKTKTFWFLCSRESQQKSFFIFNQLNVKGGLILSHYVLSRTYQFYGCEEGFNNKDTQRYCLIHNSEKLKMTQGIDSTMRPLKMM